MTAAHWSTILKMSPGFNHEDEQIEEAEGTYCAKCLGGSLELVQPQSLLIFIYPDRIFLDRFKITVPYSSMTEVQMVDPRNEGDSEKVSWGVVALPLVAWGLIKKSKCGATIIKYLESGQSKSLILDFEKNFRYAHRLIYDRMIKFRLLIKSDKPAMGISVQLRTLQVSVGNVQNFLLNVRDNKSNQVLQNVKITGGVFYPTGGLARFEDDVTDKEGCLSYSWEISQKIRKGIYTAKFSGEAAGFKNGSTSISFEVI
jgi:hypothetical protein